MRLNTLSLAGFVLGSLASFSGTAAEIGNLALKAAEDYRARAAFPEWSRPITDGVDPVVLAQQASRQRMQGPQGAAPALETWVSRISARPGESLDLFARLDWLSTSSSAFEQLRQAQNSDWQISATLIQDQVGQLAELNYADDGRGADAIAGDGIYAARLTLDDALAPPLGQASNVMIKLRAVNAAGEQRHALGGFLYSNPGASLTGQFAQRVENGHLVLLAEAEVLSAGRYHLSGTLQSLDGIPLATAQQASALQPGRQWLQLPYYGAIFHQLGALKSLQLGSITLSNSSQMPNALGELLRNAHTLTIPALNQLTSKPFADPDLLDTARRLQASVLDPIDQSLRAFGL